MKIVSFLICGLESRPWEAVRDELERQIKESGKEAEVIVDVDNGELSSGTKRQRLIDSSAGEYVVFVDDDDTISDGFVSEIVRDAETLSPDIISFNMMFQRRPSPFEMRRKKKIHREVWKLGWWPDNRKAGKMSANHLCAWKSDIAKSVAWCPSLGYGDDQLWYGPLYAAFPGLYCHHIDKVLYTYLFNPSTTQNQTSLRVANARKYFGIGLRCFMVDNEILIEDGTQSSLSIKCRNRMNETVNISLNEHQPFHTVTLK